MMRFLFFNAAGTILFERDDAESASVTHEEMSFQALFPFDKEKEILRGMRIGYQDSTGTWQAYEIRKVRTLEPDHYQEIGAENIAISELTDEFCEKKEITNKTVAEVLNSTDGLLTGTGWTIGTNTTSNTSSCDIAIGDIWNATRTIQQNWNVYIIPRITVGSTGITGKYLDVMPAEGTWRGVRLSLDKNANELGVIWDDSKVKTALYGFGQEKNKTALTFKDVVWTTSGGNPANKPANQTYVEDTTATAAYGRNGRPRFGYYQNASITDAATLLQKTWEVLQTVNVPDVTVNASITDLYRLGYVDVPLRLHDTALVEIRPTGVVLQKEIIQYTEDLLDPLQSRLTIGTYIPNIIYINRQANKRGGGGGRGSGDSQDPLEYTIENNTVQITIDSTGLNSLCVGTGAQLNPDGSLVVDGQGNPVFIDGGSNMYSKISQNSTNITTLVTKTGINSLGQNETLYSEISQNAYDITLKVAKGDVATQLSVECGNVTISGGNLKVSGYVEASNTYTGTLYGGAVSVTGNIAGGGTVSGTDANFSYGTGYFDVVDANSVDTLSITLGTGTFTKVVTGWLISGTTLTLYSSDGTSENFSKAGSINVILKNSQTWKPAYFTHGGWDVSVTASGVNVSSYTDTITVDGAMAWSAGWSEGYDDCEAEFTSTSAYVADSSGSYHLRGTSVSRVTYGMLYDSGGSPMGSGSWYLVSANRTLPLYYGNGTTLASATLYSRASS